jgi:hypothetical protein
MKKTLSLPVMILLLILGQACKKNTGGGGTNPGGGHATKKWLVKSISAKYDATKFSIVVFKYDDTGRILQMNYGFASLNDTFNQNSILTYVDFTYDSVGHLAFSKPSWGPGSKYVYLDPYSIQVYPWPFYPASDPVGTYNFNSFGHLELDSRVSFIPKGQIGAGTSTHTINYNSSGGVQGESDIDDKGNEQDEWAFVSAYPDKPIPNPLVGTSLEQRLVYFSNPYGFLESYDMFGSTWSNGIMEAYSYGTGTKKVKSDFGNKYRLNAAGLVVEIDPVAKSADPGSNWQNLPSYYLAYEQH